MPSRDEYLEYLRGGEAPKQEPAPREPAAEHLARGVALANRGEWEPALAEFDRALAVDPSLVKALNNRGYARMAMKDFGRALADLDAALMSDPLFAPAYNNRGLV